MADMITTGTEWMTPEDVSAEIQVPVRTLGQWRYERRGPRYHRLGKHVRYRRGDLDAWIASCDTGGTDPTPAA